MGRGKANANAMKKPGQVRQIGGFAFRR